MHLYFKPGFVSVERIKLQGTNPYGWQFQLVFTCLWDQHNGEKCRNEEHDKNGLGKNSSEYCGVAKDSPKFIEKK